MSGGASSPPPPGGPPLLYAQLSSASSSLSLDELGLAAQDYDEEDPMSPQSVFPRVRQKLREEASSSLSAAALGLGASGGVLSGIDAADQSGDPLALSLPSPVAVAAAAAASKKRCGRQLPEIPQTVRCVDCLIGRLSHRSALSADRPICLPPRPYYTINTTPSYRCAAGPRPWWC
jgi:hypothetical protein